MSKLDEMISRYRELEQIAKNTDDVLVRQAATDERLNLHILIQKAQAVDASQAIAGLVNDDPQRQFEKQSARIKADEEHTKKVDAVLEAMAETETRYSQIPTSDVTRRHDVMGQLVGLRLQLQKLQTSTEA